MGAFQVSFLHLVTGARLSLTSGSTKLGLTKLLSWKKCLQRRKFSQQSGLNGDKAPGPDGFPLAFWSYSWDFVKGEVLGFFKEFFEHNKFVKSLNATFLS